MGKTLGLTHLVELHEPLAQSIQLFSVDYGLVLATEPYGKAEGLGQLLPCTRFSSICEFAFPMM